MDNKSLEIANFFKDVLINSYIQFISLLSIFFFFGFLLYILARSTRITFVKSIGSKFDMYITGWIGTPVHELGHALFCIPFGHTITEMKLFCPRNREGSLGYVNHSFNPKNPWHKIGNFFIALGPILLGSFVIALLVKFLVPNGDEILNLANNNTLDLSSIDAIIVQSVDLFHIGKQIFIKLFSNTNLESGSFWIFLYISMSIASHCQLSPSDLKGLRMGLISIFSILLLINFFALIFNFNLSPFIEKLIYYSFAMSGIFTISTIISSIFFLISYFSLNLFSLIRNRRFFLPL